MLGGYAGTLLRVNLTRNTITKEPLPPEEELRTWLGGTGLGLHLLAQRLRPGMEATDPDTPVMVMTGPLTGTKAPSSSDWTIVTLHAHIPYAVCASHAHGYFGARLKHAGYDGIIIEGVASRPVYLWIDDDEVELRDASPYWGLDTFESQLRIQTAHDDVENISVACIGPAGEEMLRGGSVRCDRAYGCSKGGSGVIWGSKKLKAIAVRGTGTLRIDDNEGFLKLCQDWRDEIDRPPGESLAIRKARGIRNIPMLVKWGTVPAKNFSDPEWQVAWGKRFEEDLKQWKVSAVGSWECPLECHNDTLITTGPFAGTRVCGYGTEAFEDGATNLGIEDPGTCMAMANFYDAMGCDPSEAGRLIAMAFELYNKGLITEKETGGLKLDWGNDEAARDLFMQMLYREEPLGAILAKGHKKALRELGVGSEDMFVHIKGAGFNSHDLRGFGIGVLFQSMVSGAGPTLQGFGVELWPEPDLGYPEQQDPADPEGKAEACYRTGYKKLFEDSTGICWFIVRGVKGITNILPKAVSLATGWDLEWEEARAIGERVIQLQRMIAVSRGFKKENDLEVSAKIIGDAGDGSAKGRNLEPHLAQMLDDYYEFVGWDVKTGVPKPETLNRLGLGNYQIGVMAIDS